MPFQAAGTGKANSFPIFTHNNDMGNENKKAKTFANCRL